MKKYDFIFICQYFYPEYVSSATLPFDTAEYLVSNSYSVKVLCGYPKEYTLDNEVPLEETISGIDIKRVKYVQLKRSNVFGRIINFASFFVAILFRIGQLKNCRSIIVYSNPPLIPLIAAWAKMLFGVKIIFICYDIYPEIAIKAGSTNRNSIMAKAMRWINQVLYPRTDLVITLSEDMKMFLLQNREIGGNIVVIPNWHEDKGENILLQNANQSLKNQTFIVSYLGNMGLLQDMDTILDAAIVLKDNNQIRFLFAGHGSKKEWIESEIKRLDLHNVVCEGFLHGEDYLNALRKSNCCLVSLIPGVTDFCSPSKIYAYMMMGKPNVAIMDSCQLSNEIVQEQAGVHIKNGDAQSLVNFLIKAKAEPNLTKKMGLNARKLYETKYSKQVCMSEYWTTIKSLMKDVKASEIM
ncbi:MAG: glycosyltransferase family 4 protein [Christensenellales bacterium]|jgi:glycosyltransferase involved in cell wall biosynthesis